MTKLFLTLLIVFLLTLPACKIADSGKGKGDQLISTIEVAATYGAYRYLEKNPKDRGLFRAAILVMEQLRNDGITSPQEIIELILERVGADLSPEGQIALLAGIRLYEAWFKSGGPAVEEDAHKYLKVIELSLKRGLYITQVQGSQS